MRGSKRQIREGAWELRVSLGQDPVTGRWKQLSRTFHGGARAADAALGELVDQQVPGRVDGVGVTVGQLLDEWLAECDRVDLSPTTIRNYRSQVDNHVRLTLAKVKLARLTAKHPQAGPRRGRCRPVGSAPPERRGLDGPGGRNPRRRRVRVQPVRGGQEPRSARTT